MIRYGKRLNKKKIPGTDMMYTIHGKDNFKCIALSKDKTIEERVKDLHIDNAIIKKDVNCLRIWIGPRAKVGDVRRYWRRTPENFEDDIYVVQQGKVEHLSKLCYICKDKMKGIVDECTTINQYSSQKESACEYKLTVPDTTIDLSQMREVSNGMLNTNSPFRNDVTLEEISFTRKTIDTNIALYKGRAMCGVNKKKKVKNHCPKCIFQCDWKLINTKNVNNKCCLTYEDALKNGFFKDLKFNNSTSIYNGEVMFGWGRQIALNENKYNKQGGQK
jgi:hypothetical protein